MLQPIRSGLTAAGAALILTVCVARAHIINPAHCTTPTRVAFVGHQAGQPDDRGTVEVIVRDFTLPLGNVMVVVDASFVPDVRLSAEVVGSGLWLDCQARTVRGISDATGTVRFTIVGAATGGTPECFAGSPCDGRLRVYADGVLLGMPLVSAFDLDGVFGVGGADLSLWLQDFGSSLDPMRSDYDGSGIVDGADLSLWLAHFGAGGSTQSAGVYCP